MELDTDSQNLIDAWRSLHLQNSITEGSDATKARLVRQLLAQVQFATAAKVLSQEAAHKCVIPRLAGKYDTHMDASTTDTAKGDVGVFCAAKAQLESTHTDMSTWKSSLLSGEMMKRGCVKAFMEETELARFSQLYPADKENSVMDLGEDTTKTKQKATSYPPNTTTATYGRPAMGNPSFWNMRLSEPTKQQSVVSDTGSTLKFGREKQQDRIPDRENEEQRQRKKRCHDDNGDWEERNFVRNSFKTAHEQLTIEQLKKCGSQNKGQMGANKRSLGTRRGPSCKFVSPVVENREDMDDGGTVARAAGPGKQAVQTAPSDVRLKNIDPKMIELITNEIMDHGPTMTWDDIAGLEFAKKTIKEIVIWPMLRPDIFTGLRAPPRGLLLFGPPGTGKTLIGKCIASQSKSTFFSISASSLTSKWVGEGEKMVRALFAVARVHQPAVIFIDEIDSLLTQRSDSEHESSRRIKTEFLVQLDGATTTDADRILVIGATNRPQEIDEAARRRFVKRLYVPLPESVARGQIVSRLLAPQRHQLTEQDMAQICEMSQGYSGADTANLCREAALGPIRSMEITDIENISSEQVRPIMFDDFEAAFKQVRPSVCDKDLDIYLQWNSTYGSWAV